MSNNGKWDLSGLYSGHDDPAIESDMRLAVKRVDDFVDHVTPLLDRLNEPAVLREALVDYEELERTVGTGEGPHYFAELARAMDSSDENIKSLQAVIGKQRIELKKKIQFFEVAVGNIKVDDQSALLDAPELAEYRTWLEVRFEAAAHDLSDEVQKAVLDLFPQAYDSWVDLTSELLSSASGQITIDGVSKSVPFNELSSHYASPDADLVRRADKARVGIARRYSTVAEHEINAAITTIIREGRLKKYTRFEGESFQDNGFTGEIVDSMLSSVEDNYDISHGYYFLKARLMGRDTMHYYERAMAYGSLPTGYSFDRAAALLREVLAKLNPDFVGLFDTALAEGKIDHLPRKGKRGGAACWNSLMTHPTYMMLSFGGEMGDVETLAHEFGHFLNNLYMQSGGRCDGLSFGVTLALAEVASTFFEKYILDAILQDADEETRLAILMKSLGSMVTTVFRQTAATRFEQRLYAEIDAKGYVSKARINALFTECMSAYLGPAVTMDAGAEVGWVHWMHFRYGFYNYSYVCAQLISSVYQDRVDADPEYISEFCRLLETGRSRQTADVLESLQLNIADGSIWAPGLAKMRHDLAVVTELAIKLGAI